MGKYRAHRLPTSQANPTVWRCMGCRVPLGQVEGGMLRVAAHNLRVLTDLSIDRYGNAGLRCACGAVTAWWAKASVVG
jgi:hypothetical protein